MRVWVHAVASERRCVVVDRRCRDSEGKAKIEGYMSVSDEEAHHWWWVYPSDTLLWPFIWVSIVFLTLQILWHPPHWCDLPQPLCEPSRGHHWLYPIPIAPSAWYHVRDLPYDLWTTLFIFSFLSLFSFTPCILLWPDQSQVIAPHGRDLTICFATHKPCACFTYHLYLRLWYLLWKRRKFFPRIQT